MFLPGSLIQIRCFTEVLPSVASIVVPASRMFFCKEETVNNDWDKKSLFIGPNIPSTFYLSESNSLQHLAAWLDWPLDREMIFGNGKC